MRHADRESRGGEPALVIVDTMARSLGALDENSTPAANAYLDMVEKFRSELQCSVLTVAHASNKDRANQTDIRGSSAFAAGMDSVWATQKNDANKCVMVFHKWAKNTAEMPPIYFQLSEVEVKGLGTGAVLESVPEAQWKKGVAAAERAETDEAIKAVLYATKADAHPRGFTHREMSERLNGPKPEGDTSGDWETAVIKCKDRLRKRKDLEKTGLGSSRAMSGGTQVEWRWHL